MTNELKSEATDPFHFVSFLQGHDLRTIRPGVFADSRIQACWLAYRDLKVKALRAINEKSRHNGPYVVAARSINGVGFAQYEFSAVPYIHKGLEGATQEARRLARDQEKPFAVFGYVLTADVEQTTKKAEFNLDDFAGKLAFELQKRDQFKDMPTMRAIVDGAIKDSLKEST